MVWTRIHVHHKSETIKSRSSIIKALWRQHERFHHHRQRFSDEMIHGHTSNRKGKQTISYRRSGSSLISCGYEQNYNSYASVTVVLCPENVCNVGLSIDPDHGSRRFHRIWTTLSIPRITCQWRRYRTAVKGAGMERSTAFQSGRSDRLFLRSAVANSDRSTSEHHLPGWRYLVRTCCSLW